MFSLALLAKRVRRNSTLDYCFLYLRTKKRHINRNFVIWEEYYHILLRTLSNVKTNLSASASVDSGPALTLTAPSAGVPRVI